MTAGTRAFLAGIAIFVGVLVIYYGVFTPAEGGVVTTDPVASPVQEEQEKAQSENTKKAEKPQRRDDAPRRRPASPRSAERTPPAMPTIPPARRDASIDRAAPDSAAGTGTGTGTSAGATTAPPPDRKAGQTPVTPTATRSTSPDRSADRPERTETVPPETPRTQTPAQTTGAKTPAKRTTRAEGGQAAPQAGPPPTTRYTIRPGDTFSSIADAKLGDARKWRLIAKANPLVDPKALQVGQVIKLPSRTAATKPKSPSAAARERAARPGRRHVIKEGETLSDIAEIFYDDANRWLVIYEANRPEIGTDPNRLRVGMVLIIPRSP